jgi:hypothetical protein
LDFESVPAAAFSRAYFVWISLGGGLAKTNARANNAVFVLFVSGKHAGEATWLRYVAGLSDADCVIWQVSHAYQHRPATAQGADGV